MFVRLKRFEIGQYGKKIVQATELVAPTFSLICSIISGNASLQYLSLSFKQLLLITPFVLEHTSDEGFFTASVSVKTQIVNTLISSAVKHTWVNEFRIFTFSFT